MYEYMYLSSTYLKTGNRPKKAMKVTKEMASTTVAMVAMMPMLLGPEEQEREAACSVGVVI